MHKLYPLLLVIVTLAGSLALGDLESPAPSPAMCKSIDNSASLGAVRQQKDIPWCFAYAAADLVTQAIGRRVSAIAAGQTYYDATNSETFRHFLNVRDDYFAHGRAGRGEDAYEALAKSGKLLLDGYRDALRQPVEKESSGWIKQTIDSMSKYGICLEDDVPSDGGFESKTLKAALLRTNLEHSAAAKRKPKSNCPPAPEDGLETAGEVSQIALNQEISKHCKLYMPGLGFKVHQVDVPSPYKPDQPAFTQYWTPPDVSTDDTKKTALASLDEALDGGKIAAIYYSSRLLTGAHPKPDAPAPQEHASSIVARRCDASCQCTYELRNSWSKDACRLYADEFKNRCSDGNVWLTADEIKNNIHSVMWLD